MDKKPYSLSVKAIVIGPDKKCLIIKRSMASKKYPGCWDFPGGKLNFGELPGAAIERETKEETGLSVQLVRVAGCGEMEIEDFRVAFLFFEAEAISSDVQLSSEHEAFQWVERTRLADFELCQQFKEFAREYSRATGGIR